MIIYIPTFGRPHAQVTYHNIPAIIQDKVVLVVYASEKDMFPGIKTLVCPPHVKGIAAKRQFIIDQHDVARFGPHIVMMDDDLRFFERRSDDPTKFQQADDASVIEMLNTIGTQLLRYAHVGVLGREGGNRVTVPFTFKTRMMRVLAYDVQIVRGEKIDFARGGNMCDFDVTLQLLQKGYANAVLCNWVQDQGTSNAPGGCSLTRSLKVHEQDAKKLHANFPEFVKLVSKTTKTAWGGATRTDVQVQWKRAYNENI